MGLFSNEQLRSNFTVSEIPIHVLDFATPQHGSDRLK